MISHVEFNAARGKSMRLPITLTIAEGGSGFGRRRRRRRRDRVAVLVHLGRVVDLCLAAIDLGGDAVLHAAGDAELALSGTCTGGRSKLLQRCTRLGRADAPRDLCPALADVDAAG